MSKPLKWGVLLATAFAVKVALGQEIAQSSAPATGAEEAGGVEIDISGGELVLLGNRRTEVQKDTTQVVSLLSSEDIARTGEGDIAGALGRVTGLSVVGNGLVYVRGLGDRYSLALMNGSPLPSPEPLRRAVPLDLFPTDVVASSLVQKTYSPNFPGEFGGGVINLTTLNIPKTPFLNLNVGLSGNSETTGRIGYDYRGSSEDWTGYGNRRLPQGLRDFFASGQRISAGNVDTAAIAKGFVGPANGLVQGISQLPANFSGSVSGGNSWMLGDSELGFIATAGYSNKWNSRENRSQTPGSSDLSSANKDYRSVETGNRIVTNALLGVGYQFGEGNRLRWTNLYVHDTLKRTSLAEGQWVVTYTDWDFREQSTAWYERQLVSTQLSGDFRLADSLTLGMRGSYSHSSREAPYELSMGYARNNVQNDPYGAYFINRLSGQNRNFANIAFSDLGEDLWSGGADLSWALRPGMVLSAGYDYSNTERDSTRREFQIRAPSTFPNAVAMFRPDYLLGDEVIDHYGIGLIETTETDPAFAAQLRVQAGYAQLQAELVEGLELSIGARYETARQSVRPLQVFSTLTNSGASTRLDNDYLLPAATLTWKLDDAMQVRLNASRTIARPQFRELMFQRYYDPEANREYLGNPLLTDAEFTNAEARFEWYFAPEQRVTVAGFYKQIDKPIEAYASYPEGDTPVTSYANAPKAQLYGVELEAQKYFGLDRLSDAEFFAARRVVLIGNYTWSNSKIKVGANDTVEVFGSTVTTRAARDYFKDGSQLSGQSDHLVNLQFGLEDTRKLSQQTLLLTYASDRVTSRAGGTWPDIKESPGLTVDFVARQGFTLFDRLLDLKLEVRNIFGRDYQEFQKLGSNTIYYNRYDIGRSFAASIGTRF
ncbi:MAG: TonB-dependent receptor [Steroidobacteraceae bacterium]